MAEKGSISRRQFVASAISVAAASSLPVPRVFGSVVPHGRAVAQDSPTLTNAPGWKDQGVENLAKSPHAKLRDIPVHAVTIQSGFWAKRRGITVSKRIRSMPDP